MTEQFRRTQLEPPAEIKDRLGVAWRSLQWFSYPSVSCDQERGGLIKEVDILGKIEWALTDQRMKGVVMDADSADGCLTLCDTCVRDSQKALLIISRESWDRAWQTQGFRNFFDGSFRWGDCADPSDHKDVAERAAVVLNCCPNLCLEILVNYRGYKADRIAALVDLLKGSERLALCISLPLNKNTKPQDDFQGFEQRFLMDVSLTECGGKQWGIVNGKGRLEINDLRRADNAVSVLGRIAAERHYVGVKKVIADNGDDFCRRGNTYIHLGPEGFWVEVSATLYESYTGTVYTPLNKETISLLQKLPLAYKGYLGWPGGSSVNDNFGSVDYLMREAAEKGKPFQPRIVD